MPKQYVKVLGEDAYIAAIRGTDAEVLMKMTRKEAARHVGELIKWRDYHREEDPTGMAELFWSEPGDHGEPSLFELVDKAEKHRYNLYNKQKPVKKIQDEMDRIEKETNRVDSERYIELREKLAEIEDAQVALCLRIRKIYMYILNDVGGVLTTKSTTEALDEDDLEY